MKTIEKYIQETVYGFFCFHVKRLELFNWIPFENLLIENKKINISHENP